MSGPKVVRVRTRAELVAECQELVDELQCAIDHCQAFARNHALTDLDAISRNAELLKDLASKLGSDDFDSVRGVCRRELAVVTFETERLEKEVLRRAAQRADRRRRCQKVAVSLVGQLRQAKKSVPMDLERLQSGHIGADDTDLESAESIVSRVLASQALESATDASSGSTEEQRVLARKLLEDSLQVTEVTEIQSMEDAAIERRVVRLVSEIRALDSTAIGQRLLTRADSIVDATTKSERALRIDSLELEWLHRRKELREISEKRLVLDRLILELAREGEGSAVEMSARVAHTVNADLDAAIADARHYLDEVKKRRAAQQRKQVVLEALAALGYEIGAELSTAWMQRGRIVVRRPDRDGYGVELAAPPDASQMQFRVVALRSGAASRDGARDRDAETMWCSDLTKLQQLLVEEGSTLRIERALGVGAVPLAEIASYTLDDNGDAASERLKERTIR